MSAARAIARVHGREILDSRGNPTVEVDVVLADGSFGRAAVPSGASTGVNEAVELRDGDKARFGGKGVLARGRGRQRRDRRRRSPAATPPTRRAIDELLIDLDGTPNKRRLGANAILGASLARAHAAAAAAGLPLYRYLGGARRTTLPVPFFNILNGGKHAVDSTDFQEFMVAPVGAATFAEALRAGAEVFAALRSILHDEGHSTGQGDEGGFAPSLPTNEAAVEFILRAIEKAGYRPGEDVAIALDPAVTLDPRRGHRATKTRRAATASRPRSRTLETRRADRPLGGLARPLPDRLARGRHRRGRLGRLARRSPRGSARQVQLVGDDLFVTNPAFIERGDRPSAPTNAVLIKLNQIGTLTETIGAIELARARRLGARWSATAPARPRTRPSRTSSSRSGTGQIKSGAPSRSERVAKYNRLLRIEEELGDDARYAGPRRARPRQRRGGGAPSGEPVRRSRRDRRRLRRRRHGRDDGDQLPARHPDRAGVHPARRSRAA